MVIIFKLYSRVKVFDYKDKDLIKKNCTKNAESKNIKCLYQCESFSDILEYDGNYNDTKISFLINDSRKIRVEEFVIIEENEKTTSEKYISKMNIIVYRKDNNVELKRFNNYTSMYRFIHSSTELFENIVTNIEQLENFKSTNDCASMVKTLLNATGVMQIECAKHMNYSPAKFSSRLKNNKFTIEELLKIAESTNSELVCYFRIPNGKIISY